jgi:hypothetical protein
MLRLVRGWRHLICLPAREEASARDNCEGSVATTANASAAKMVEADLSVADEEPVARKRAVRQESCSVLQA